MKYKVGDYVILPVSIPKDANSGQPGWNFHMTALLGKTAHITEITRVSEVNYYKIEDWSWKEEWIEGPPLSHEERICNKIKQLDQKWKENQQKKGNYVHSHL